MIYQVKNELTNLRIYFQKASAAVEIQVTIFDFSILCKFIGNIFLLRLLMNTRHEQNPPLDSLKTYIQLLLKPKF